jgi:hypothetical protein
MPFAHRAAIEVADRSLRRRWSTFGKTFGKERLILVILEKCKNRKKLIFDLNIFLYF